MKKKLTLIAMTLALLALVITPTFVFAQDQETTTPVRPIKDGLAIVAPRVAAVGQKISVTVFQCSDQTPVSGAGVWALTLEKIEALRAQISQNKGNDNQEAQDKQYEDFLGVNGTFLGRTDESGKIWHTFNDDGRYVLVTYKATYWPDIRQIIVGSPLSSVPRLVIDAPNRAEVGEKITITVSDKSTQEPVKDAGVWAVTREKTQSLKTEIAAAKTSGDSATIQAKVESILKAYCIFLGTTNEAGIVQNAFEEAGGYVLVTFKPGYWPALKTILIVDNTVQVTTDKTDSATVK